MRRERWQNDVLEHKDYDSSKVTEELIRHQNKIGNLRLDPNGNLISSRVVDKDTHMPIIDIDVDHFYIPSRTPGHAHLYLNVEVPADKYLALLQALRDCRLLGEGNVNQMIVSGHTSTRLPLDFKKYENLYKGGL